MTKTHYHYIIAGGGGAGLSLVHHLLQTRLSTKNILIFDRDEKQADDRTWCFWEAGTGPFEDIVHHRWQQVYFHGENYSELLDLAPYRYKMIRSGDFYRHVKNRIATHPNVTWLNAEVQSTQEVATGAQVVTSVGTFTANWVFNSLRNPNERAHLNGYTYLLQHFKGWVIKTPTDFFNPEEATLMDFRIEQHGECRFFYVLPTDSRTALVEFTLFSPDLLSEPEYETALRDYLLRFLSLDDYTIAHEELGVIPMTDKPYPDRQSEHIVNIGTAGGMTKPSTGYTFQRIQRDSEQLVGSLLRTGRPARISSGWDQRFRLYDSTLFQVMEQPTYPVKEIFTDLFRKNPADRVLRFLDERSNFREELQIANSVNRGAFARGMWRAISS
jgi:lycopene beta-cyclase